MIQCTASMSKVYNLDWLIWRKNSPGRLWYAALPITCKNMPENGENESGGLDNRITNHLSRD